MYSSVEVAPVEAINNKQHTTTITTQLTPTK